MESVARNEVILNNCAEILNKKEINMRINENEHTIEISLKNMFSKIKINSNYEIYTNDIYSCLITEQPNLELYYGRFYLDIKKEKNLFTIETNQDIELSDKVVNIIKKGKRCCFKISNLSEIRVINGRLKLKVHNEVKKEICCNDKLIISENEKKVILPYSEKDIISELKTNKNKNAKKIIDEKYTIALEKYSNPILSRYREAYNLMLEKEKKSKLKAVLLGIELMFEFKLHPAIITACKNLEELDYYLNCMEEGKIEKFPYFKIEYKIMPIKK